MVIADGSVTWTKRALRVIHLAHEEAKYAGSHAIGLEHILLGLLREGHGMGAEILRAMQVDEGKIRQAIQIPRPPQATPSLMRANPLFRWLRRRLRRSSPTLEWDALRLDEQAKQCLDKAIEEVQTLHVRFVGTEHLLFGLASIEEGDSEKALGHLRLDARQVHEHIVRLYRRSNITQ